MNFIAKHPFPLGKGCFVCRKILRSRIFLFLCIRLYVIGKEDRAEETHQGCVFVQVSLAENKVFRQAGGLPVAGSFLLEHALCAQNYSESPCGENLSTRVLTFAMYLRS